MTLTLVTIALFLVRAHLDKAHVALAYLLVVLVVSSRGGRALGVVVSVAAFLCFNFFFLSPYHTLSLADPLDWGVLGAFLLTSIVAAQLLVRARNEAASAEMRAREVERLARAADRAETLQRADEAKNAVLASVSHDLRTPLTTIKALAHEIRQEGDERAATIEEEADRLNRFVADLLDLSRLAAGGLQVQAEVNAAEDLVGAAVQRVSGATGDRIVVASLDTSEPLLLGRFDFAHSLRALGNLIDNAVKFAPARSTVEVRARRNDGALEFLVADRGPGIPAAERDAVFQPFFRAAGTADSGGVGLGLSIASGLAAAQGGSVRFEPREGGGSVFIFSVPAADLDELTELPEGSL